MPTLPTATGARDVTPCVGVDGCRGGWIAVSGNGDAIGVEVFSAFEVIVARFPGAMIAVDMPIGLPDRTGPGGRGPERLVRPLLGARQSSVFSIPARAAVYAEDYREACDLALTTSDPPRRVSKQAFHIFPRIREIDGLLRADTSLRERVREAHPEVAFWQLNGRNPVATPKKIRGAVNPAGLAERIALLMRHGIPEHVFLAPVPRGAAADDRVDAAACLLVARRIMRGEAVAFPDPPLGDGHGIAIAIHA